MKKKHPRKHKLVFLLLSLIILTVAGPAGRELQEIIAFHSAKKSIVELLAPDNSGGGTGFELEYKSHRYTVTNGHVCGLGKQQGYLVLVSPYAHIRRIKILEESAFSDLCLLEPSNNLPSLKLGEEDLKVGEALQILGHPLLGPLHLSAGRVTTSPRLIQVLMGYIENKEDLYACSKPKNRIVSGFFGTVEMCLIEVEAQHTTAQIEPGNSGSPVLDYSGKVRGVAFAANREDGEAEIIPWSSLEFFLNHHVPYYQQNHAPEHP